MFLLEKVWENPYSKPMNRGLTTRLCALNSEWNSCYRKVPVLASQDAPVTHVLVLFRKWRWWHDGRGQMLDVLRPATGPLHSSRLQLCSVLWSVGIPLLLIKYPLLSGSCGQRSFRCEEYPPLRLKGLIVENSLAWVRNVRKFVE